MQTPVALSEVAEEMDYTYVVLSNSLTHQWVSAAMQVAASLYWGQVGVVPLSWIPVTNQLVTGLPELQLSPILTRM